MSEDLKYLIQKIDKIDDRMDKMGETMIRNTISLEEHIRRTNLLEASLASTKVEVIKRIRPMERAYNAVKWLIPAVGLLGGATLGVLEILIKLKIL